MADMSGLRLHLEQWTNLVMVEALDRTLQDTQDAAPVRTGALRASITVSAPQFDGQVARADIVADVPYAGYTDTGTAPHPIYGNPLLAFYWEKVGRFVVFRSVNHPGTRGTQWFNAGQPGGEPMLSRFHQALEAATAVAS